MNTTKSKVQLMLDKLPDNCSIEEIQYHLYVFEKIHQGLTVADGQDNTINQEDVEGLLSKWLIE